MPQNWKKHLTARLNTLQEENANVDNRLAGLELEGDLLKVQLQEVKSDRGALGGQLREAWSTNTK